MNMAHPDRPNVMQEYLNRAICALLTDLTDEQIDLCAADLCDLDDEVSEWGGTDDTLNEWLRRIGGWRNVRAYAESLQAGKAYAARTRA